MVHRQRLVRDCVGEPEFAGPAIRRPPSHARAEWADKFAAMSIEKPVLKGLRRANKTLWLKPEIGIRAQHLRAKKARLSMRRSRRCWGRSKVQCSRMPDHHVSGLLWRVRPELAQ